MSSVNWLLAVFLIATIIFASDAAQEAELDYIEMQDYVDLSMELTILFKDEKNVTEAEIHEFSKKMVRFEHNPRQQHKFAAQFLTKKNDEFKKAFMEKYLGPKITTYVTTRVDRILSSYLTKQQIEELRTTLTDQISAKSAVSATLDTIREKIAKDVGGERAEKTVDLLLKDLKILYKMYPDVLEANDNLSYIVKTEL